MLTVGGRHGPVSGKGSAAGKQGDLGADETEDNVNGNGVDDLALLEPLAISCHQYLPPWPSLVDQRGRLGKICSRQTPIDEQHAGFATPDGKDHGLLGYQDPFASRNPRRLGLWRQGGNLLFGHEVGSSAKDDLVDRYIKQGVPQDVLGHNPVIGTEPGDTKLVHAGPSGVQSFS